MSFLVGDADDFFGTIEDVFAGRGALTARLPPLNEESDGFVSFEKLRNRFGKINIKISPEMMGSDEAIAAVGQHELHELSLFRKAFERGGGRISFDAFMSEAMLGNPGNFHSQAWDAADALILAFRGNES